MPPITQYRWHYSFILQYLTNIFDIYERQKEKNDGEKRFFRAKIWRKCRKGVNLQRQTRENDTISTVSTINTDNIL